MLLLQASYTTSNVRDRHIQVKPTESISKLPQASSAEITFWQALHISWLGPNQKAERSTLLHKVKYETGLWNQLDKNYNCMISCKVTMTSRKYSQVIIWFGFSCLYTEPDLKTGFLSCSTFLQSGLRCIRESAMKRFRCNTVLHGVDWWAYLASCSNTTSLNA